MRAEQGTATDPRWSTRAGVALGLVVLVWASFGGVLSNGWILLDDHEYVTQEPHVLAGLTWDGWRWFLGAVHVGNWHPLTSWSHMLDVQAFGTSPRGPHAENVVLHTLTVLLLAHVLFLYTRRFWASACVAALFAVHPLRVESVAWISERKDVLSGVFFVLVLWSWHGWIQKPGAGRLALTTLLLLLGLMAKSMLVTTPCVLLLLETWPLRRPEPWWRRLAEKWPLFLLSGLFVVVTLVAQSRGGATADWLQAPGHSRLTTAITAYGRYLAKTILPVDLAPLYPYEIRAAPALVVAATIVVLAITALGVRLRRSLPAVFLGWCWFAGMLVPVIGLVQVGTQSHADRYTYLPSIGLAIVLVFPVAEAIRHLPALRAPALAVLAGVLFALTARTRDQVGLWRDTRGLFEHTLRVTRENPTAQKILGDALLEQGDLDGAIARYREALRLAPGILNGHKNLGCALARSGRPAEAIPEFEAAVEEDPSAENLRNLGWALSDVGRAEAALVPLRRGLEMDPSNALLVARLGAVLADLGRADEALPYLVRAVELAPGDLDSRRALARVHLARGEIELGLRDYRSVLERDPDDLETLVNLARNLATQPDSRFRDGAEAVRLAEHAQSLVKEPIAFLQAALAAAYAEVGRFGEAVRAGERAVEIARAQGDSGAAARFDAELEEYRAGRSLRPR